MITVQSPTRIDLAGGTLDLWPLYCFLGNAYTVNLAIDIQTQVELQDSPDIIIESIDLNLKKTYASLHDFLSDKDERLNLLKSQVRFWQPTRGFYLKTISQSPVGGGLGGSSSLTISLIKAFAQFCQKPQLDIHKNVHEVVKWAHNIEAEVLNTPTGTQDYYPAFSGGLNILHYSHHGIEQKVLSPKTLKLSDHCLLVYTGKSHHSGINNFEVFKRAVIKDPTTMRALYHLQEVSQNMVDVCEKQNWGALPDLFRQEYSARIRLAPEFSSAEIEKLALISEEAGADAIKICGAGGGGCVLIWVQPQSKESVARACQKNGFQVLPAKPVEPLDLNPTKNLLSV